MSDIFTWWPVQKAFTDPRYRHLWRDLVGAWPPIGRGNTIPDVSGQNNSLVVSNAAISAAWVGGVDGWMFNLDGTNDKLVGSRITGLSNRSAFITYIPDTISGTNPILSQGDIVIKQVDDDIVYGIKDNAGVDETSTASTVLTERVPVDIVVTYSGTTCTLYLDGELADSFVISGTADTAETVLNIGYRSEGVPETYTALTPTNITGEKTLTFAAPIDIQYSRGSQSLNDAKVYEIVSGYQGSVHAWVVPTFASTNTDTQYICDLGNVELYWDGGNTRWKATVNGVDIVKSDTFAADTTIYIRLTWDSNVPTLDLEIDGSSAAQVTSAQTVGTPSANLFKGQDSGNANEFLGQISWRISNEVESSFYDSGDGDTDMYIVRPDAVLPRYSEDDTGIVYHHSGKSGTTDNANFTTDIGVFGSDNDAITISDSTGYSVTGFIDGTPAGVNIPHDDGAGSPITDVEKVGVNVDFDASYWSFGGDIHDIGLNDFCISFWLNLHVAGAGLSYIIDKNSTGNSSYRIITYSSHLRVYITDADGDQYYARTPWANYKDGQWRHFAIRVDRDSEAKIYINGYDVTDAEVGTITDVGDITSAANFSIGGRSDNGADKLDGKINDVKIYIGGLWTDAHILYQATHPHDVGASAGTITEYYDFDEDTGMTITAGVTSPGNDLTLSNAAAWDQQAYVSKNLLADGDMENGGIGGITVGANQTVTKDPSVVFKDSLSLKDVYAAADDNDESIIWSPTLVNAENYWQRLWIFPSAIHDNSKLYLDWDGAATPILSREIGKSLGDNGEFARDFNLNASRYAQAANNGIHDIGLQDIGIWAWVKVNSGAELGVIVAKRQSTPGYQLYNTAGGVIETYITDGTDGYTLAGNTDIRDNIWHFIAVIIDRNNAANCKIYRDGFEDGTTTKTGTLADVNSIASTEVLFLGANPASAFKFDGFIAEWGIAYPADIMAAGEMGDTGEIANLYNNPSDPSQWPNHEDHWLCNDNAASTVVVGANNNLIASANTNVFAETHWKMYDMCFVADQTGITEKLRITDAGAGANSATVYVDSAELRVNMVDSPGMEGGANPPAGWTQEGSATVTSDTSPHSGTNCLKVVAGAANVGASQNVALVDATNYTFAVWAKVTAGDTAALVVDTGDGTIVTLATTTSTTWTLLQGTFLSTGVSGVIYLRGVVNGDIVWFDDASGLKPDTADASTATFGAGDVYADGRVLPAMLWKRKLTALEAAELSRIRQGMFAYHDETNISDL